MSQDNTKPFSELLKNDYIQHATKSFYNEKIVAISAKYAPGQQIQAHGKSGKIVSVHEEAFFAWGGDTYYEYVVELADGTTARLPESALAGEPLPTGAQNPPYRRLCECGAWAVPWAAEHHARWCPESWRHR